MKKHILILLLAVFPASLFAAGGAHLDTAPIDIYDKDSIKRGAKVLPTIALVVIQQNSCALIALPKILV